MATPNTPTARTRLYISPFNPTISTSIIPPSLQQFATNISFHTIETFPENSYGYLELPTEDAQRIRKKLNGSFLKGMKLKIEEARPDKKRKLQEAEVAAGDDDSDRKARKRAKKEKRAKEQGVFAGVELPEGREVKRGWTQPGGGEKKRKGGDDKRKEKKVKKEAVAEHKDQEMLFRTHLPPNVASRNADKEKKKSKERKSKGKPGKDAEVKEFAKTTKYPSFLRAGGAGAGAAGAVEFVDGKGWVDVEGNVVEGVVETRSTKPQKRMPTITKKDLDAAGYRDEDDDYDDNDDNGPNTASKALEGDHLARDAAENADRLDDEDEVESSSDDALEDASEGTLPNAEELSDDGEDEKEEDNDDTDEQKQDDGDEEEEEEEREDDEDDEADSVITVDPSNRFALAGALRNSPPPVLPHTDTINLSQASSSSATANANAIPTTEPPTPAITKDIHPLEALYKRPAPSSTTAAKTPSRPGPLQTSFSFFGAGNDDDDEDDDDEVDEEDASRSRVPVTPFTQRDFESRGLRSAAPTPDTAAIGRRFQWNMSDHDDDDDEAEDAADDQDAEASTSKPVDSAVSTPATGLGKVGEGESNGQPEQTEFEKHFWAMRGEYNRSWKARKREARKEVRQGENRRVGYGR